MAFGNRSASSATTPSRTSTEGPTTTNTNHTGASATETSQSHSNSIISGATRSQSQALVTLSSGGDTGNTNSSNPDLAVFVQDLMGQMQTRFSELGDSITGKMDDMGRRMDELEGSESIQYL